MAASGSINGLLSFIKQTYVPTHMGGTRIQSESMLPACLAKEIKTIRIERPI